MVRQFDRRLGILARTLFDGTGGSVTGESLHRRAAATAHLWMRFPPPHVTIEV
jgi:hypothetical protein